MNLTDFDYFLPQELIASEPKAPRDAARLLIIDKSEDSCSERIMAEFPALLLPGDLVVLNDTRVIPARLFGTKESGGKAEVFLVRRIEGDAEVWECLIKASKSPKPGTCIMLSEGVVATVKERFPGGAWRVLFCGTADFSGWLQRVGKMPLPPYIRRESSEADRERYQTVFSRELGAVAAPTAGLHFTGELLDRIRSAGAEVATLTLHVGLGTFLPVRVEDIRDHQMHCECFSIPDETANAVARCREKGGRVIAIGTTVARTLESAAGPDRLIASGSGETDIFIYPGYKFRVVDALLTNFHLPKSTLLMLVSAFAGRERILDAYKEAVSREFRFYSYGDAMFIH